MRTTAMNMAGVSSVTWVKSCQREPRRERTRSSSSGSTSRNPLAVLSRMGKTAIEKAIIVLGSTPYLNQTMNSGPSATLGIMFRVTSSGRVSASRVRDQVKPSASATPTTRARK
jgi:hypothetical protein